MAITLGVISPNMRIRSVIANIDIPIPLSPKSDRLREDAVDEASIFTNIFPMSTVMISLRGLFKRRARSFEFFTLSNWRRLTLTLLKLKSAVSEPEKNAEHNNNITNRKKTVIVLNDKYDNDSSKCIVVVQSTRF